MIVLSRKKNESLVINDDITITVIEVRGDKVRLGIDAPKELPLHRGEVFEAIRRASGGEPAPAPSTIQDRIGALQRQIRDLQAQLPD